MGQMLGMLKRHGILPDELNGNPIDYLLRKRYSIIDQKSPDDIVVYAQRLPIVTNKEAADQTAERLNLTDMDRVVHRTQSDDGRGNTVTADAVLYGQKEEQAQQQGGQSQPLGHYGDDAMKALRQLGKSEKEAFNGVRAAQAALGPNALPADIVNYVLAGKPQQQQPPPGQPKPAPQQPAQQQKQQQQQPAAPKPQQPAQPKPAAPQPAPQQPVQPKPASQPTVPKEEAKPQPFPTLGFEYDTRFRGKGTYVARLIDGGPLALSGLQAGDVIDQVEYKHQASGRTLQVRIDAPEHLRDVLMTTAPDSPMILRVRRLTSPDYLFFPLYPNKPEVAKASGLAQPAPKAKELIRQPEPKAAEPKPKIGGLGPQAKRLFTQNWEPGID